MKHHRPTAQRKRRHAPDEAHAPAEAHEAAPSPSVALLRDAGAPQALRAESIAGAQRAAGNAAVERALVQRAGAPAEQDLPTMQAQGGKAQPGGAVADIHFAGVPVPQAPPGGANAIRERDQEPGWGPAVGWTGLYTSAAFTPPALDTARSSVRKGFAVEHYAEVLPTTAQDVTHESFYVAPGDHLFPSRDGATTEKIRGGTYTRFLRVSGEMSALVRDGEQEHLSDAFQAYLLTFKLVADKINELAGQRFGPTPNPYQTEALAFAELGRRLPPALGSHHSDWVSMFDRLRRTTKLRDYRFWHSLDIGTRILHGRNVIYPLIKTATTKIGQVPSEELIKYPS